MSESPEEQPTGVLGRIGSWLSPWRGKGPTSPTEQASPTGNQTIWLEGEEESEETVRPRPRERQWEKEKEQSFNSSPRGFYRDATQSARRDGPVASGTETAAGGGGPKEVEFEERTKKRTGQGKEREESSSSTWTANRNPEKYASHLTHLSSSSEQGAVRDTDRAHNQPVAQTQAQQAQAGKRLQWYLEETSVIQDGQDTAGQGAAVCTEIKKGLQVLPKAKSSSGLDSPKSSRGSPSAERKRTNVSPAVGGTQSYYSALVGVSLKPRIDSQSEAESVQGETEADSMGRKNSAKRKFRKNSQGDGGETPPNAQLVKEGLPTSGNSVTSPQGISPKTHTGESSVSSSSKHHHPTSQASPEGVESKASCPDASKQSDNFPDSNSTVAAALECVFDGALDMEDVDSLYKVERKTETPESKRRSLKVSRSEVKLFTKYVPLKKSQPGENQDSVSAFKDTKDEAKDEPTTETYTRPQELKKIEEQPKPVTGRIADKISLFEHPAGGLINQTLQTRRSSDASPITNVSDRLKANLELSEQRSRSAERYDTARSGSASRVEEKQMTVKERARNFAATSKDERPALPPKPAMTGMSPPKSTKLDNQGKLDTKEQTGATSEMTSKQDRRDSPAVGKKTSSPKEQLKDLKTKVTVASKTNDQGKKPNSVETDIPAKGPGVSTELSNDSPQPKSPGRASSRSKRRKSREPTSPMSPNSESKSFFSAGKPEITAVKQEQMDNKKDTASPSKQLTEKDSLASDKAHRNQSDTEPCSDTKQKAFKKEFKVMDKQNKQLDSSFKKENISKQVNRQEGLPEPSVNKNEPDTAACSSGTKTPIDKDSTVLPQKEETAGEHSLSFTQQTGKVSKDIRETSASTPSPAVERPMEEAPSRQKEPPIEHPKLDKELSMQSETKLKGKATEPKKNDAGQTQQPQNKATKLVKQAESKVVEKAEKEEANRPEDKDNGKSKQLLPSDKNIPKARVSESGQGISQIEGSVARDGERKNASRKEETQPVKGITKSETNQPEQSSEKKLSGHPAQTQHVKQTKPTYTQKTAMCALIQTNEAVSGTLINKGPSKGETATNVPPELITISTQSPGTETAVIAAEPQLYTVSVGQKENSQNDSSTRGAIDGLLSSTKPITKATRIIEGVSVKAGKEPTQTNVSKSVSSEGAEQGDGKNLSTVKSMQSEENISGDIMKVTPGRPQCEESQSTKSTSEITSVKCADKKAHRPTDSSASNSTVTMVERTAEKTIQSPRKEHSPVANGDISPLPQLSNKTSQKAPSSPDSKKMSPDSVQRPILKKLPFPRGLSKDDSAMLQDAPSSWLDVDIPKEKLKVMAPRLSTSGSESNLLDTPDLDDDDFVEKIKKLCAPFSLPPRKHNQFRPPQPPFALPAIREDRFEKTFDPEEFMFGLSKKKFSAETGPSALALLKKGETKSGMKPARSVLLSGLDSHSRLRDKADDDNVFEEKDERVKVKSRLEGSCVFSSLSSSNFRAKRTGVQQQTDGTTSGDVSPSEDPRTSPPSLTQPIPPSHTATASFKDTLAKQSPTPSSREEAQAAESVVSDSSPPFPSFNDIKLPNYLEKYLPREPAKPMQSIQGQEQARTEVIGKMTTRATTDEADMAVKPGQLLPEAMPPCFPGIPPTKQTTLPELKKPMAQPQAILGNKIRTPKGFHKRPGKIVLFEEAQFRGQVYEIYRDVADATSLQFSPFISVKVIRGCWVLYEKPDFQGRSIPLEEGGIELENMWAEPGQAQSSPPMSIGSIRHAVWDYSIPRIDLFTEPEGHGRVTPYHDETIETGSFGVPVNTASIQVHSGVWLLFSDPGFQGMLAVLETGVYPFPEAWGFPSPFVGSLRPLKMGGFKVENPSEVKAVVYEKPGFEGPCLEIDSEVLSFCDSEGDGATDGEYPHLTKVKSVGSLKVIGGLWVGYCEPGFEGQQHILEEGEYLDCSEWGGSDQLLSLRPILGDFMSPHVKMFSNPDLGDIGVNIDFTVAVINMEDTGYGVKTQSIDVISGIWVVFEEPGFCGESYILEKGLYGSPEDWGALQPRVGSAMPVVMDDLENAAKFKVQLFSKPSFQGNVLALEDGVASLQDGFCVASCKVLAGSWLGYEGQDYTGRKYVLEVGSYPDLRAMGCFHASSSILSLQTIGFEFSLPSIALFERGGLRGKRVVLTDGLVNLQLAGGCSRVQSVLVEGGMWILYEEINYRGAQILLKPGEVPDWHEFSSWRKIGSLRPLIQKQVHFRLRNSETGLLMSVNGDLDEVKLLRIQELEETGGFEQIWSYQNGHLHCKIVEECCLGPSGTVILAGSRVGLKTEPSNGEHLWSLTPEGYIRYTPTPDLVLEVKGGNHYDKNQVILNKLDPNKPHQRWYVEII